MKMGRSRKNLMAGKPHQLLKKKRRRRQAAGAEARSRNDDGLEIPVLEAWEKQERCVVLFGHRGNVGNDFSKLKVMAWYPDRGEVGLISATSQLLMPPNFWPLDSCAGFVCGMNVECLDELSEWKFRVAVSKPSTNYQVELPVLDITHLPAARESPETQFFKGRLRLRMTQPLLRGELFCVHLTTSCGGVDTVHSFNTICWRWESSASFSGEPSGRNVVGELLFRHRSLRGYEAAKQKWTAMAGPGEGKPWDADLPVPERFSGSSYTSVFPFRYGKKIMAACGLSHSEFVLLELGEAEGWRVVASAVARDFFSCTFSAQYSEFCVEWPAVRGELLVLSCDSFSRPVAFDLKHHLWIELPMELAASSLALDAVCVYEP